MKRRDLLKNLAAAGTLLAAGPALRAAPVIKNISVSDTPVILECAINGSRTKSKNPLVPETDEEQSAEIIRCLDTGAAMAPTIQERAWFYQFGTLLQTNNNNL